MQQIMFSPMFGVRDFAVVTPSTSPIGPVWSPRSIQSPNSARACSKHLGHDCLPKIQNYPRSVGWSWTLKASGNLFSCNRDALVDIAIVVRAKTPVIFRYSNLGRHFLDHVQPLEHLIRQIRWNIGSDWIRHRSQWSK